MTQMKGNVLDFSIAENQGLISGDDGQRYTFVGRDWKSTTAPRAGMRVDFEPSSGTATAIYIATAHPGEVPDKPIYRSSDDKMLGGVCAGLAHKFQISRAGVRVATVILTLCTGVLFFVYLVCWIVFPEHPTRGTAVQ